MPILRMPEYGAVPTTPKKQPAGNGVPGFYGSVGYSGSGWNYPSSSLGGSTVKYSTTPGTAPTIVAPSTSFGSVPSATVPGASALPANTSPPNLDIGPYMGELTSDPLYQSGLASYQSALQGNRSALSNALKQAIIQGGWGAGKLNLGNVGGQDLSGDLDQATLDAASQNQMSDRAQLQTQLDRGLAGVGSQLAARGAARSGAANIMSSNLQNQYDVASNSALQNLAQALGGDVSIWAQNNANALGNWNTTQGNVANRLAQIASAQAQAAYSNSVNQPQQVNVGQTQITSAPSGPSSKTAATIQAVKKAVANAKKIPTAGYGGGGWTYNGVTYG